MTIQTDLAQQIASAKERVRLMAQTTPDIFPEYSALKSAQEDLELAQRRLAAAQAVWDRISK